MAAVNPNDSRIYTRSVDLETIVEQRLLDIFGAAYRVHQTTQHGRSLSRLMRRARAGCGVKATATHRRLMPGVEHRQSKYLNNRRRYPRPCAQKRE